MNRVPCEIVFNPNWWLRNYGISFEEPFYFDSDTRIQNDVRMRRALYERFGIGDPDPQARPIIGSEHVAGGFIMPALFGCQIRFSPNQAPWPVPRDLSAGEIRALMVPDWKTMWPMKSLIADMDSLDPEFGRVCGDFDLDGVLNTALQLRSQQLFVDFYEDPELVHHLFTVITETQIAIARYVRGRTGTCAVSTNRSILHQNPALFLHSNCSVEMISPKHYAEFLLPYERRLADELGPYGVHHCGSNLQAFLKSYATLPLVFVDVGWGSSIARSRQELPDAFLNLRLSPVRMLQQTASDIRGDVEGLLAACGSTRNIGICCINMDYGTPDENVHEILGMASSGMKPELCAAAAGRVRAEA